MICTRTCRGRVVYNRKKHIWNIKDVIRIIKKGGASLVKIPVSQDRLMTIIRAISTDPNVNSVEFGGGSSGGGGASGDFSLENEISYSGEPNGVVIIEESLWRG